MSWFIKWLQASFWTVYTCPFYGRERKKNHNCVIKNYWVHCKSNFFPWKSPPVTEMSVRGERWNLSRKLKQVQDEWLRTFTDFPWELKMKPVQLWLLQAQRHKQYLNFQYWRGRLQWGISLGPRVSNQLSFVLFQETSVLKLQCVTSQSNT